MAPRQKEPSRTSARENNVSKLATLWMNLVPGDELRAPGLQELRRLLAEYSYVQVCNGMQKACDMYLKLSARGKPMNASAKLAFDKIGAMCWVAKNPDERTFVYIRGIFNNREVYYPEHRLRQEVHYALGMGVRPNDLISVAKWASSWSAFCDQIDDLTSE